VKERTLILVKPDGVQRGLVGEVIRRVEAKSYRLIAIEVRNADRGTLERHYHEHKSKAFFEPLLEFMMSGPIVAIVAEGDRVIEGFRSLAGATDPTAALPGTIRGDFARQWDTPVMQNIVHGSDSGTSAEREIEIWFPEK
jgi:nucleoside-diphosphate kinase